MTWHAARIWYGGMKAPRCHNARISLQVWVAQDPDIRSGVSDARFGNVGDTGIPMAISNLAIEHCVLDLLGGRAITASICPSDVARAVVRDGDEWRALMPVVRQVAARLANEGIVLITQRGTALDPDMISHGPIRLRRGPKFPVLE
jgi:hypothetical protein